MILKLLSNFKQAVYHIFVLLQICGGFLIKELRLSGDEIIIIADEIKNSIMGAKYKRTNKT